MVFMHMFCFCCSVRLGSIVVGIKSMIGTVLILLVFAALYSNNGGRLQRTVTSLEDIYGHLDDFEPLANFILRDPESFIIMVICLLIIYMAACGLLIYGSYRMNAWWILVFIIVELIRLIFLFTIHVISMKILKRSVNLGVLIGVTITGGFLLLFHFYLWACTISLFQMLRHLASDKDQLAIYDDNSYIDNAAEFIMKQNFNQMAMDQTRYYKKNITEYSLWNNGGNDYLYNGYRQDWTKIDKNKSTLQELNMHPYEIYNNHKIYRSNFNEYY